MSQPGNKHPLNVPGLGIAPIPKTPPVKAASPAASATPAPRTSSPRTKTATLTFPSSRSTAEDFALAQEQLEACPVTSIGADGE